MLVVNGGYIWCYPNHPVIQSTWGSQGILTSETTDEIPWKSHGNPMEIPWKSHGNPMEIPWKSHGNPMKSHGNPMEIPWNPMEIPWKFHGNPMKFHEIPWKSHGNPMKFHEIPWKSHGNPMKFIPLIDGIVILLGEKFAIQTLGKPVTPRWPWSPLSRRYRWPARPDLGLGAWA